MMEKRLDLKIAGKYAAAFALLSCSLSFAAMLYDADAGTALIFSVYQVFLIFIPGMLLASLILAGRRLDPLAFFFVSFAFGYTLNILEYFVIIPAGLRPVNAFVVSGAVLLLLAVIGIRKKPVLLLKSFRRRDLIYLLLFLFLAAVIFFASVSYYVLPDEINPQAHYHRDGLYWIENAAALKISFPPQELRYSGMQLFYHFFVSIYVAFASFITGIDCFRLGYSLCVLTRAMLLFGGIYVLGYALLEKDLARILLIVGLLFSTGKENNTQSAYVAQLIYLPFGFDMSVGFGAFALAALSAQSREERFSPGLCASAAAAMLMCAGHKAPAALVYMLFAGIVCLGWLLKKQSRKAFSYGIPLVLAFAFVMVVCVGVFHTGESRVDAGTFGINANLKSTWLYEWHDGYRFRLAETLSEKLRSVCTWLAAFTVMEISFHPFTLFLDICGFISLLRRKRFTFLDSALLAAAAFGIGMGSFNDQGGMSQMYYSQAAFLPGIVFGLRNFKIEKKPLRTVCCFTAAALLMLQIKYYFADEQIWDNLAGRSAMAFSGELPQQPENSSDWPYSPDSIQYSDYLAMEWIRDNTPIDSLIVTDRDTRMEMQTYMYHGAFSERQMYLEGDCYLYGAYSDQRNERRNDIRLIYLNYPDALQRAKDFGADYVIETKWIEPHFEGAGCTPVFETETVRVWKID